jgi:tetratricopeptide (TPR) repeat protein
MSTFIKSRIREANEKFAHAVELISRNKVEGAMKNLEASLQISPNNADYLSHYGLCVALDHYDYRAARKLCERAIRLEPREVIHKVNLGRVLRLQGDIRGAHRAFIHAWKLDTSHPAAATELVRMGVRRPPVLPFLDRSNWLNIRLGRLRTEVERKGRSQTPQNARI